MREPNHDPLELRACAKRPDHEEGAPKLYENIGCGKGEPACAEGVRNRHREPRPANMRPNRSTRPGVCSGSSQLVTEEVKIQTHQTARNTDAVRATPSGVRLAANGRVA